MIDCVIAGTADHNYVPRPKVKRTLERKPFLAKRLENARLEEASSFTIERARVENVVLKLARGHAAHELNEPQFDYPSQISFLPLATLARDTAHRFETPPITSIWPEVGSRALLVLAADDGPASYRWIEAQPERYRYLAAVTSEAVVVRMVLSEYLACEVSWSN